MLSIFCNIVVDNPFHCVSIIMDFVKREVLTTDLEFHIRVRVKKRVKIFLNLLPFTVFKYRIM